MEKRIRRAVKEGEYKMDCGLRKVKKKEHRYMRSSKRKSIFG